MGEEVFIDANIFLEIFLKDVKSEECKIFLKSAQEQNKLLFTSDYLIYSCFIGIENNLDGTEALKNAILFFNSTANLKILKPSFDDFYSAVEIMENSKLDFDDSLVVACMKSYGIKELASLDRHFDKVKGIERVRI